MTQENKELLLQDLSARLPYGVKGIITYNGYKDIFTVKGIFNVLFLSDTECCKVEDFKPYLRSMSSMTIDEFNEWLEYCKVDYDCEFKPEPTFNFESCHLSINWLNKNHFDYRGLIERGLAIEVTEDNNPYE